MVKVSEDGGERCLSAMSIRPTVVANNEKAVDHELTEDWSADCCGVVLFAIRGAASSRQYIDDGDVRKDTNEVQRSTPVDDADRSLMLFADF